MANWHEWYTLYYERSPFSVIIDRKNISTTQWCNVNITKLFCELSFFCYTDTKFQQLNCFLQFDIVKFINNYQSFPRLCWKKQNFSLFFLSSYLNFFFGKSSESYWFIQHGFVTDSVCHSVTFNHDVISQIDEDNTLMLMFLLHQMSSHFGESLKFIILWIFLYQYSVCPFFTLVHFIHKSSITCST